MHQQGIKTEIDIKKYYMKIFKNGNHILTVRVHIVIKASKSTGAKGDAPKSCGFVHLLHPSTHTNAFPVT